MDRTKRTYPRRLLSLLLAWLLCISCVQPAFAASETAKTVQLMKTEGTVSVTNSSGKSVSLRDSMRLYNGYQVVSDKASYAWFNLDSSKLSKLDEVSGMELRKSGKKLELLLNSGNLFFNVTEPLEEDETLNIRTSTMVVGIRGTCGWVEVIDQWHSRVRVLEGRVTCSVTDPVTGQTKTTVLTGGEWAECVVYPQDRSGDKCDIIRQRFTEEDIPGFALVELVGDGPLCEKIFADSGLDLRDLTQARAQEKLRADQAAMAEKLGESQRAQEVQERHVSTDPVWEETASDSGNQGDDNGTGSAPSAPAVSPAPADTSGVTSTTPVTTQSLTMTMPVTIPQIQAALNRPNASAVTVVPGTENNTLTQLGTETLTVDAGKTLTLDSGVDMVVQNPGTVNVNGTMNVNGNLDNYGIINVTSANSLHVSGYFRNHSTGDVNNIESGHIVPAQGIENSGTISTSGNAVLESPAGATVKMMDAGAELNLNGGSISNNAGGNAILWTADGGSPGDDITNTDTTSIWTTGSAPLAVENADGTITDNPALDGYKVVSNDGQTSLRPTGGVEGGVIVDPVTVSFDANGGRWSGTAPSITVERGQPMGVQSQAPTREGYTFVNWQDASGTVYTESTAVTADTTLYAQWRYEGGEPAEESVTVTFMNEGAVYASIEIEKGGSLPYLPIAPERGGYIFTGWGGTQETYGADTTITAQWQYIEPEENEVTITFMNEGAVYASITIEKGSALPYLPAAPTAPAGKAFDGWEGIQDTYNADTTITAQWQEDSGTETVTVTFYANHPLGDASSDESLEVTLQKGQTLNYQPMIPIYNGYMVTEWTRTRGSTDYYYDWDQGVESDFDLYAVWEPVSIEENIPDRFTVAEANANMALVQKALYTHDTVTIISDWIDFDDPNTFVVDCGDLFIPAETTLKVGEQNAARVADIIAMSVGGTLTVNGVLDIYGGRVNVDGEIVEGGIAIESTGSVVVGPPSLDGDWSDAAIFCDGIFVVQGGLSNYGTIRTFEIIVNGKYGEGGGDYDTGILCNCARIDGNLTICGQSSVRILEGQINRTVTLQGGDLYVSDGSIGAIYQYADSVAIDGGYIEKIVQWSGDLGVYGGYINEVYIGNEPLPASLWDESSDDEPACWYYQDGGKVSFLRIYKGDALLDAGAYTGGVYIWDGELTINGGCIPGLPGRTMGGLTIAGGRVEMNDGNIIQVFQSGGELYMTDGVVKLGYAIHGGTLEISGGIICESISGPAITINGGIVTIKDDAIIRSSDYEGVIEYSDGTLSFYGGTVWNTWSDGYAVNNRMYRDKEPGDEEGTPDINIGTDTTFIVGTQNYDAQTIKVVDSDVIYEGLPDGSIIMGFNPNYSDWLWKSEIDISYAYYDAESESLKTGIYSVPINADELDRPANTEIEAYMDQDGNIYVSYHYEAQPRICYEPNDPDQFLQYPYIFLKPQAYWYATFEEE